MPIPGLAQGIPRFYDIGGLLKQPALFDKVPGGAGWEVRLYIYIYIYIYIYVIYIYIKI